MFCISSLNSFFFFLQLFYVLFTFFFIFFISFLLPLPLSLLFFSFFLFLPFFLPLSLSLIFHTFSIKFLSIFTWLFFSNNLSIFLFFIKISSLSSHFSCFLSSSHTYSFIFLTFTIGSHSSLSLPQLFNSAFYLFILSFPSPLPLTFFYIFQIGFLPIFLMLCFLFFTPFFCSFSPNFPLFSASFLFLKILPFYLQFFTSCQSNLFDKYLSTFPFFCLLSSFSRTFIASTRSLLPHLNLYQFFQLYLYSSLSRFTVLCISIRLRYFYGSSYKISCILCQKCQTVRYKIFCKLFNF